MLIRSHQPGRDSWMVILPADDFSRVVFFPCEFDTLTLITTMMSCHPRGKRDRHDYRCAKQAKNTNQP